MNPYSLVPCDGHQLNFALWYAACVAGNDSKRSSPFRISVLTQQHPISVSTNHYVSYIPYWCSCSTCYIMSLYMFLTWLSYREGWRWWWGSNHPLHLVMQGEKETTKPFKETKKTTVNEKLGHFKLYLQRPKQSAKTGSFNSPNQVVFDRNEGKKINK